MTRMYGQACAQFLKRPLLCEGRKSIGFLKNSKSKSDLAWPETVKNWLLICNSIHKINVITERLVTR